MGIVAFLSGHLLAGILGLFIQLQSVFFKFFQRKLTSLSKKFSSVLRLIRKKAKALDAKTDNAADYREDAPPEPPIKQKRFSHVLLENKVRALDPSISQDHPISHSALRSIALTLNDDGEKLSRGFIFSATIQGASAWALIIYALLVLSTLTELYVESRPMNGYMIVEACLACVCAYVLLRRQSKFYDMAQTVGFDCAVKEFIAK